MSNTPKLVRNHWKEIIWTGYDLGCRRAGSHCSWEIEKDPVSWEIYREDIYSRDEKAYLRVTPVKGTHRFGIKGKLAPRYIGPFHILTKRGEVAFQLELHPHLSQVHNVFHVSQLRRCFKDPICEVDHETLDLQDNLSSREYPVRILDEVERSTRRQKIRFCKVQWSHHS